MELIRMAGEEMEIAIYILYLIPSNPSKHHLASNKTAYIIIIMAATMEIRQCDL